MLPLIGITAKRERPNDGSGLDAVPRFYTQAVVAAGGIPVVLPVAETDRVPMILDRIDGLLLSGGGDIDPSQYGGKRLPEVSHVDPERDEFELALAREAANRRMPTLAICRGMQVVNVALGGTLIEDLPTELSGLANHMSEAPDLAVQLEPGCRLSAVMQSEAVRVNSLHHQAVRDTAASLRVVGRSSDGVIEAVESTDPGWPLLAVQWHPERMVEDPGARLMFTALVQAAAAARLA